jgi:hypothetical protein
MSKEQRKEFLKQMHKKWLEDRYGLQDGIAETEFGGDKEGV